ncbi:MAG: FkbM family methyltransferase [Leptolyngbyaceae cyanobacterium]
MNSKLTREVRQIAVDIDGVKYKISSDDNYLDHISKGFEPHMVKLFKVLARDSTTILDIGGNIGCTAILFGTLAGKVHVFEPSQTTFSFLDKNVVDSGMKNIVLHNIGLGSESMETTLTFAPSNRSGGFVSNQTSANSDHIVEKIVVRQLDEIATQLNFQQLDFIKIDVEGFEGHVLRGATETLSRFQPIVTLELNHWCLNAFQRTSIPDFFDFLRSVFPVLYAVDGSSYMDLHDADQSYSVMYHHILNMKFLNIVGGFKEAQFSIFKSNYTNG